VQSSVTLPPSIQAILHEFEDVFQIPKGLPPKRDCEHRIVLKEGANPPNIRPYRIPPNHHLKHYMDTNHHTLVILLSHAMSPRKQR
jgi:hypothetical protein